MRPVPRLFALTPGQCEEPDLAGLERAIGLAVEAGLPALLIREPKLSDRCTLEFVRALRQAHPGLWIALHDRTHLAQAGEVDAVHLGFRSLPATTVREQLPPAVALGVSLHATDLEGAVPPADYGFYGPVFATPKAHVYHEPVGWAGFIRAAQTWDFPLLALGGLGPEQAAESAGSGAHGVAVLSGILRQAEPGVATANYLASLGTGVVGEPRR